MKKIVYENLNRYHGGNYYSSNWDLGSPPIARIVDVEDEPDYSCMNQVLDGDLADEVIAVG